MSETSAHTETKMGSEKHFGVVVGSVSLIFGLVSLFLGGDLWKYMLPLAAVSYLLALFAPDTLCIPNRLWFRFGLLLHAIFSPIIMLVIYVVTFVPTGMIFRLRGKDLLHREFDAAAHSYWIERTRAPGSMKRQF